MLRLSLLFTRRNLGVGALLLLFNCLAAQTSLFVPRNYLKPYDRGTRSWDGKPGPNYWQNRSIYTINASIEPQTRRLSENRGGFSYFA